MDITTIDKNGEKTGNTVSIEPTKTGNQELVKQQVRVIQTNLRQGNAHTKTRSNVSGGGKKPWRQKGTGRARVGSIRSPLWRGGGIIHGPKTKTWSLSMPKKMKQQALNYVISNYVSQNKFLILDNFSNFDKVSTKYAATLIKSLNIQDSLLVVTTNKNVYLSFRNIKHVIVKSPKDVNILDILKKNSVLTSTEDLEILKERII